MTQLMDELDLFCLKTSIQTSLPQFDYILLAITPSVQKKLNLKKTHPLLLG
jgi:hypothetical protein